MLRSPNPPPIPADTAKLPHVVIVSMGGTISTVGAAPVALPGHALAPAWGGLIVVAGGYTQGSTTPLAATRHLR